MEKTFKKYLTATVFILLSCFLLFQAKATSGFAINSITPTYSNATLHSVAVNAHFTPISSGFDANSGKILIEESEAEDLDCAANNDDQNPGFFYHSVSALFYFLGWEHILKNRDSFIAYQAPSIEHCKRYNRFEIFRI